MITISIQFFGGRGSSSGRGGGAGKAPAPQAAPTPTLTATENQKVAQTTNPPAAVKKNFSTGFSQGSMAQSVFDIATKNKSFYNKVTKPFVNKVKNGTASNDIKSWTNNVIGKAVEEFNAPNKSKSGLYTAQRNIMVKKLKEYYGLD